MTDNAGLYLHVPFCASKCAYCDFYSLAAQNEACINDYTAALCREITSRAARLRRVFDTVYLGGGTPSLLGGERIARILSAAAPYVADGAEITLEANPADDLADTLSIAAAAGVCRLSLGIQSADESELRLLSRRHKNDDVIRTVRDARAAGIENISFDLMLGIPRQTAESLSSSLDFCLRLKPRHLSVYILKVEPDTPFGRRKDLPLPDEDAVSDMYLAVCDRLRREGFIHYEISNFALPGFESRHNLKYWTGGEYLGVGPAAHSFLDGRRSFYPRDIKKFIEGAVPLPDGEGGGRNEFIMLRLRLCKGFSLSEYRRRFGEPSEGFTDEMLRLASTGLCRRDGDRFYLTERGFLLSNEIIARLLAAC